MNAAVAVDPIVERARPLLELDRAGRPRCRDARAIVGAIEDLVRSARDDVVEELVTDGFLRRSEERFAEHVAARMRPIPAVAFEMGTRPEEARHFCGEVPRHPVELSPFAIAEVPVTNELYALLDGARSAPTGKRTEPVVDVTWHEALLFALWVGCRLPTEAEWEYSCGGGAAGEWCCGSEDDLTRHAWFSENARGSLHPVACREPNALGLFDMHGNVWEWCLDEYDQDFYAAAELRDPICRRGERPGEVAERVCRGGSMYALAEMCRTRYRFHEAADFWAGDLGFRLARGGPNDLGRRRDAQNDLVVAAARSAAG